MDVITTHVNADFDCLGAMAGARRLYPDALLVFSGSQEKSMRDFFQKSPVSPLTFTRLKDLDMDRVTRLILVDCQHSSRIGPFAEILDRPGLQVHIYDHHPESHGDIPPTGGIIRACGSSTTIVSLLLEAQGIEISAAEATLMMLGVYEDTGSLVFPSTTVDDYRAASWLLRHGANLNTVADFITQELNAQQVSLLNDLLGALRTVTVNGVEIAIAHASLDRYVGDIAALAHMMRDMENLQVLFLVVGMGDRVHLIARSRIPEVNVGEILRELGGGGHATAASATMKEPMVAQALNRLQEVLERRVNPVRFASDIMSVPVKTIAVDATIAEAREQLTRYNINAMPVVEGTSVVGIVSRNIVEKALYHGLGSVPVSDYMHTEFMRATPATPINRIRDYFVTHNRRFVPVIDDGRLVGAVTRTDLLQLMHPDTCDEELPAFDMARDDVAVRRREIEGRMMKFLSRRIVALLRDLGRVGDELELPVYAVGGFVRDLLLGSETFDIDVTVEGDGILFAEEFARRHGCRTKSHEAFGTAVLIFHDGCKVDVASTRLEYYENPGALPVVERSSLKMDLYRRDFTINTLAVRLNLGAFGTLVDYFGAQRDLQNRSIRVLHNLSFVEDPTRVFRAVRFEQRLGFQIAPHTEHLIRNAVRMEFLKKLGGRRLLNELVLILREKDPARSVERMSSLGLLRYIHPDIHLNDEVRRVLDDTREMLSWYELLYTGRPAEKWVVYFLSLCSHLADAAFLETCSRLAVSEHYRHTLHDARRAGYGALERLDELTRKQQRIMNSTIHGLLKELPSEVVIHLMSRAHREEIRRCISLYVTTLQDVHCLITGDDLLAMGIAPGPVYRTILDLLLAEQLDGELTSREDELRRARQIADTVSR